MPLLLCGMGRVREEEERRQQQQQQQQQRAAVASASVAVVPRRGRWLDGEQQQQQQPSATAKAGWRCRSCAAVAIADCVALGCCPCAVVTLLGLVLVKAPLAVVRRLTRNMRLPLLRRKRVRDVAASSAGKSKTTARDKGAKTAGGASAAAGGGGTTMLDPAGTHATVGAAAAAPVQEQMQAEVEEPAWLDEMYRVGHWGFGRVSFSGPVDGENPLMTGDRPTCGELAATRQPHEWIAVPCRRRSRGEQSRAGCTSSSSSRPTRPIVRRWELYD